MSKENEWDIVRPLGLVTMNFAYAEGEIDNLLRSISGQDANESRQKTWTVGQKLGHVKKLLDELQDVGLTDLANLIFSCKERIAVNRSKYLDPILAARMIIGAATSVVSSAPGR